MAELTIKKIQSDPDGLDFEGLRKEGIRLVQETSGDIWTDYNLHDPGVTILESLCYALTDLIYRTGFNVEDYLASADGEIDYRKQALYRPEEILPCRSVTDNDYRKLVLNSIPNIDNVWIRRDPAESDGWHGVCRIYVQLNDRVKNQENDGVRKAYKQLVEKIFSANRNLCEDLAGVEIVDRELYSLGGEIEIDGQREAATVLAEIYFKCAQYLSPNLGVQSYAEMHRSGMCLEDLFNGILTENGFIPQEELQLWCGHFSIPDLVGIISRVEGVTNIKRLFFVNAVGEESQSIGVTIAPSKLSVASLKFPLSDTEIKLYKSGMVYQVSLRSVEIEFNRLDYKFQMIRQRRQKFDWLNAMLPVTTRRNISEYYSIQNQFPDVYGLNAYGVPDSATPERKAQAKQLKAYLVLFEQIMANFLQSMEEIPQLFSIDEQLKQSYFYQVLPNHVVPDVEKIYLYDLEQTGAAMAGILAGVDNYGNRRNRVLDYLLGIYGEKFSQNSLNHFFAEGVDPVEGRIANKISLLKEIVDISKNRAAAFDYLKASNSDQNQAGLKKKLQILLGINPGNDSLEINESEGDVTGVEGLHVIEHILLRASNEPHHIEVPEEFFSFRISVIFPAGPGCYANPEFRKLAEETVYMNCPAHIHPDIFWLEAEGMDSFKKLYATWLKAKRARLENLNESAEPLIRFLLEIKEKSDE